MQTNRLALTLDAPLAVSQARDTSNRYALPSAIPPTTLRGALAAAVKETGAAGDDGPGENTEPSTMQSMFGPRGCRSTSLLPSLPGRQGRVVPAPLTMRTCKRHGGLRDDSDHGAESQNHGAEDLLFDALLFSLYDNGDGLRELRLCGAEGCEQVLDQMGGFIGVGGDTFYRPPTPDTRTQAHVGLDRRRRGASSGVLYSREVLSEKTTVDSTLVPTRLQADVTGPEPVMTALLRALRSEPVLRVGTARSRGLGTCAVEQFEEVDQAAAIPTAAPIADRVRQFNEHWAARCQSLDESPGNPLIALTLQTPALFTDAFLEPTLSPTGADLLQAAFESEEAHADALSPLTKVHQIARPRQVQSWNGLAGFPHSSGLGLAAGSVLVFEAPDLGDALFGSLRHIEEAGIGLRRHFGFGRVRVCSPIHTHLHEHMPQPYA